jgi:drug/metabolite transporter (DMT)-like permease
MMACMASWAVMAAFVRALSNEIHPIEILFFRFLFGAAALGPWLWRSRARDLRTQRLGLHITRNVFALVKFYAVFAALALAPMGEVAAVMTLSPLAGTLGAVLILREAALGRRWIATVLAVVGALIILRPGFVDVSLGVGLAFVGVALTASQTVLMRLLSRTETPDRIAMMHMLILTPLTLVPALWVWKTPDFEQLLLLAGVGLTGAWTQQTVTRAYRAAEASVVMPFDATRLVFAALLGFALYGELPDVWTWIGGAVIFVATTIFVRLEAKRPVAPAVNLAASR